MKQIDVFYHGEKIGTLRETEDKRVAFQYTDQWIKNGFSISPFSLPLQPTIFVPETRIFNGLHGVFADSLPDAWGHLLLDRYLMSIEVDPTTINIIDRLAYVGTSGMGALEYIPANDADYQVNGYDYDKIALACKKLLESKTSDQLDVLYKLGGTSGGTRPKILITEGQKDWIIKFPATNDSKISGKREYDYSLCAKQCGIHMTQTELIPSKICDGYFKTERFDRTRDEAGQVTKHLSVTIAGLLEADFRSPACDYNALMKCVKVLSRDNADQIEQMYRVMCYNVYGHNLDDHAKNFSFLCDENGWRLAPAYDLTYSTTYYGEHTTSINGKGKNITQEDMLNVGIKAGMKKNKCAEITQHIECKTQEMIGKYLTGRKLLTTKK